MGDAGAAGLPQAANEGRTLVDALIGARMFIVVPDQENDICCSNRNLVH